MSTLPGCAPDISVAHTHRINRIFECQGLPILTGLTDIGAGPRVATVIKRRPGRYATWRPPNGPSTTPWPAHAPGRAVPFAWNSGGSSVTRTAAPIE